MSPTVRDPMQLLRVEHAVAAVLLECTTSEQAFRLSLEAIGAELGFSSDAGMRRRFKEATGMTTAQYRPAFGRA